MKFKLYNPPPKFSHISLAPCKVRHQQQTPTLQLAACEHLTCSLLRGKDYGKRGFGVTYSCFRQKHGPHPWFLSSSQPFTLNPFIFPPNPIWNWSTSAPPPPSPPLHPSSLVWTPDGLCSHLGLYPQPTLHRVAKWFFKTGNWRMSVLCWKLYQNLNSLLWTKRP